MTSAIGARHHHRGPPLRLAGRRGRLAQRSPTRWPRARASSAARSRPASASTSLAQLRPPTSSMLDVAPEAVADILGDRLPRRVARALPPLPARAGRVQGRLRRRGRRAVDQPRRAPRRHRPPRRHLRRDRRGRARRSHAGRMPERPFVLVGQQYLADPQRSVGDVHPVWSLRPRAQRLHRRRHRGDHRPRSSASRPASATGSSARRCAPRPQMAAYNANYVGGDIVTGANDIRQLVFGPRATLSPYRLGVPGVYICSAATPPGPGAHGMCGYNAASAALAELGRR